MLRLILLILLGVLIWLLIRAVIGGFRLKRNAENAFNEYWEARQRDSGPGGQPGVGRNGPARGGFGGRVEKDISDRARIIEEKRTDEAR